jgi:tRNA-Thr(GGU) m(6)t(6)A37 methyltransferase TsaA
MKSIHYRPIGVVRSRFTDPAGTPIQPAAAAGEPGTVEILSEYEPGLRDLDGFSHVILLYHLHRSRGFDLDVVPFLDRVSHGVFATRAPRRPNPIGLSIVRLVGREGRILYVQDVDVLDGTPLLDLKPYVPEFDQRPGERVGWLESRTGPLPPADGRFA